MSSNTFTIAAQKREQVGTSQSRRLRRASAVPAVIYGHGSEAVAIAVDVMEARRLISHAGLVSVEIEGDRTRSGVVKDVQYHPITRNILHVDLLEVKADEEVTASIRLEPHGLPAGTHHGGQLEQVIHEIEVRGLPGALVEVIVVEVSEMELDATMHVGELTLPEGLVAVVDPGQAVFQVRASRLAEVDVEEEEELGEEGLEGEDAEGVEGEDETADEE